MKFFLRICVFLLFIALAGTGYIGWQVKAFLDTPPSTQAEDITFDVVPGANFGQVAKLLQQRGIITDATKFALLARYQNVDNKLQAGRFMLNKNWLPAQVLDQLVNGHPILHRITLREGLTWWQVGQELADAGFVRFADFRTVINDPAFLRHHGIPFNSAEGFLMPDTYLLKKSDTPNIDDAKSIAGRLVDTFWQKTASLWKDGQKPSKTELRQYVILASIVEKETSIAAERPRVAGVYTNRLQRNMPLQADPTVIYGLGQNFNGNLRRNHLNDPNNIYNTYQHPGLPPGPICSPGIASISAAVQPEKHDYIYFVAVTDGGEHAFSVNLAEHNRAVRRYLDNRRKK